MEKLKQELLKILCAVPGWNLLRIASLSALAALIIWPFFELQAIQSSVVFFKGSEATLAWDPPSRGVVDHYVIEVTTTKELAGPANTISWVTYLTSREARCKIPTRDGYTYSFRVKAVGPAGNESSFSDEKLTVICDCSKPGLSISPVKQDRTIHGKVLHLSGSFADSNLAAVEVNGEKAVLDFAEKTWDVTIPLEIGTNLIRVTATDYAGNSFSQQFEVRQEPVVVTTEPEGGELFIMGTPSYPGIYFTNEAVTIYEVMEPDLYLPVTLRKDGYMQSNAILSFPEDQDTIVLPLQPFHAVKAFSSHHIDVLPIDGIHEMPYIFTADADLDHNYEIILSYPDHSPYLLKSFAGNEENGWNATSLNFQFDGEPAEAAEIGGQLFLIDYDGDFEYEVAAPLRQDGRIHIFECNSTVWKTSPEAVVELPEGYDNVKSFGFLDWNGDHNKDVFLRVQGEQKVHIFVNQGSDILPRYSGPGTAYVLADSNTASPVSVCDWNNDGEPDFLGQDISRRLCVWIKSGEGDQISFKKTILPVPEAILPDAALSASAVDWNHDGIYDIVVGTENGGLALLIGTQGQ